ncbi:MAG: hypothetical protein HY975_01340 [Candidatus Kerfeldbacteria bacterium]|nr:hypothetical protein [Candidatus Kerfeldbacteria bacterium]
MPIIFLPLLFLAAGLVGILYYQHIPSQTELRQRLPNRASWAGFLLVGLIALGIWLIVHYTTSRFMKVAGITTLVFYLLTFESFLLLAFRWTKSNAVGVLTAAGLTAIPFLLQFFHPTYTLGNVLIIAATLGATALVIRLEVLRTRIIIILACLFMVTDILNVTFVLPHLPLTPPQDRPLPLLIFPTVNVGGHVIGSGDFMFLALTTLIVLKNFSARVAAWHVVAQAVALTITLSFILNRDILLPYLTIMTPVFLITYAIARQRRELRPPSAAR